MVSPGYVGGPEREVDDWFPTTDLGSIGADGRLTVIGRIDSVIVTGGENVAPPAVEAALLRDDRIEDVRVYGIPDDEWGTVVAAEVVTSLEPDQLASLAEALPPAMRPRHWEVVPRILRKLDV